MSRGSLLRRIGARLFPGITSVSPRSETAHLEVYAAAARRAGIDRLYLFLSFDCDTDLDAAAVGDLHRFLAARGIKATYAVPGAQLEKAPDAFRRIAAEGAEFMNHGGLPHAEWREDRWVGITFYDTMAREEVIADIRRGHEIVTSVTGKPPRGFRAPHFGCYQQPDQLDLLHQTAAALGYGYCSTTIPSFGLKNGPAYPTHGLVELPCFGSVRHPETLLDSWTYLTDRVDYALGEEYYVLFADTVTTMLEQRVPGVLTWYADPCHVLNQAPFIKAIELAAGKEVVSVTGSELAGMAAPHLALTTA